MDYLTNIHLVFIYNMFVLFKFNSNCQTNRGANSFLFVRSAIISYQHLIKESCYNTL